MTPSDSVDKMDRFVTFPSVRPTSIRCVYRAEFILLGSDTVTVYWEIFAVLIGLEKFEKVLQIIIDYDDSSTR